MSDDNDELIARVAASLKPLPVVDEAIRAGVLVAVTAEREREQERARRGLAGAGWRLGIAGAVAAAALVAAVWMPTRVRMSAATGQSGAAPTTATQAEAATTLATHEAAGGAVALPVQLVFRAPSASRVSVVGDFTGWDAGAAAMTRDPASGLWSVTVAVRPGRHVYAFLVDDSVWVRDPRAAVAADADFERPGSVLLVGRP